MAPLNWAFAQIYKYVDPATGAVEYTNQPKKGSQKMNLDGTLSEIPTGNKKNSPRAVNVNNPANTSSGKPEASVDLSTQKTRDGTRQQVLSQELATEEKALQEIRTQMNNGKPLPMADESVGSAKYIDRVKQLEKTQRHHERNIAALKKEIELARL
jgi:DNA-directed RNA polymerase specialized sigma subunit